MPRSDTTRQEPTRIALTRVEAAASLGVSLRHFERHIQPELRLIRTGSTRLIPVKVLAEWADQHATIAGERER